MRIVDRLILSLTRRSRKRERNLQAALPGAPEVGGCYPPQTLTLAHTGERGSLSLRSRRSVARVAATAAVTLILPVAAFAGGMSYASGHAGAAAGERVQENAAIYQHQMAAQSAAYKAQDVCAARVAPESGWQLAWAQVTDTPELRACHARQTAEAADIRAASLEAER